MIEEYRVRPVGDAQKLLVGSRYATVIIFGQIGRANAVVVGTEKIDGDAIIGWKTVQIKLHAQIGDERSLVGKISVRQKQLPQLPPKIAYMAIG